jgi:hypothetical protein
MDIAHLLLSAIRPAMVPEYLRIYPVLWNPEDLFGWVKSLVHWPDVVVLRLYRECRELEGGGPFGELGPDDEAFDSWGAQAEHQKRMLWSGCVSSFLGAGVAPNR